MSTDVGVPVSGAETRFSITVDGVPLFIEQQIDSISEQQDATPMEHKPIGTHDSFLALDVGGWSGRISGKPHSTAIRDLINLIDVGTRAGVQPDISMTVSRTYRDLVPEENRYINVIIWQTGANRARTSLDTVELSWRSGKARGA
jgi:hypothetical protein